MKTAIWDLETYGLDASTGILLCAVIKKYDSHQKPIVIRGDDFDNWKNDRANSEPIVRAVNDALEPFDIHCAHNGLWFDKRLMLSWALKYDLSVFLNATKFVDPCQILRRKLRLNRNSLHSAIEFFNIPEKKTTIDWVDWKKAAFNGDSDALSRIVTHCVQDVKSLELVYDKVKRLVKGVDSEGSIR